MLKAPVKMPNGQLEYLVKGTPQSGINAPMRRTNLKSMYMVRYADDFKIFCRTKTAAELIKITITQLLSEWRKLEVSLEKTKVVNVKRRYCEFLGF